jgi:hypothetical protein
MNTMTANVMIATSEAIIAPGTTRTASVIEARAGTVSAAADMMMN